MYKLLKTALLGGPERRPARRLATLLGRWVAGGGRRR
ncbi:hypothetical protein E2C01_084523 [Portunus trituberculatus]|uniref:Uncharacterized protein n=1 Tax=Portunus trituberculatus TaxID=210409 RepID=A0A5B7J4F1_PORTR|nr:hypothetical protein [Portunus trituberculatus]